MCDTFVALGDATSSGATIFGKNSDRQRNEAQLIERVAPRVHGDGEDVQCTYIAIPQVRRTNAVLLCRPFWMWGAEMGANEHGVVVGNEAVTGRVAAPEAAALLGMDLLRLGLERGSSAAEALEVITGLLERFGQGGNCGHTDPTFYHNSFMIADRTEAFVLETAGRDWVVQQVAGTRAISNCYSIGGDPLVTSAGAEHLARRLGWMGPGSPDYSQILTDPGRAHIGQGRERRDLASARLDGLAGEFALADAFRLLRDHGPEGHAGTWAPRASMRHGLCIHAGGRARPGQTTGSLACELGTTAVYWVTASSAPCMSIFKPIFLDLPLPDMGPAPAGAADLAAFWWRHEAIYRRALSGDFCAWLGRITPERDALEAEFMSRIAAALSAPARERMAAIIECWARAEALERQWAIRPPGWGYGDDEWSAAWKEMNELAGLDIADGCGR